MPVAVTVHAITLAKGEKVEPGVTREFDQANYDDFMRFGAIREPSETEMQIWGSLKKPAKKAASEKPAPEKAAPKKAAPEKAKAAPATDADDDLMA